MPDERLRALQRAATQDPEKEAALLRERMRVGLLGLERVEVAAWCGDRSARTALYGPLPSWLTAAHVHVANDIIGRRWTALLLQGWLKGLAAFGVEVQVRAAVATARLALPEHLELFRSRARGPFAPLTALNQRAHVTRMIDAAEAWTEDPEREGPYPNRATHRWLDTLDPRSPMDFVIPLAVDEYMMERSRNFEVGMPRLLGLINDDAKARAAICSALVKWALSE